MNAGIYKITIGPYFYIGQSISIESRMNAHKSALIQGTHYNPFMQRVYDKYCSEFKHSLIIPCKSERELDRWEETLLLFNKDNSMCMNIALHPTAPTKGRKFPNRKPVSEVGRLNISKSKAGKNNPMYGKSRGKETRKKIGDSQRGKKNHNWGKATSPETLEKLRVASLGRNNSQYSTIKYHFKHDDGTEEYCTQLELKEKYGLSKNVSNILRGFRKSHKGWRVINDY